jgi:hypothetical protein
MLITDFSIIQRKPDQVSSNVSGEVVILNLNSGIYYGIEQTGSVIWDALYEPRTLQYLRDTILRKYGVDVETCHRDVMAFLKNMQSAGLIEIRDEGAA